MGEEKREYKRVVSYSQYSTYHQCPQKYKLQYIDRKGTGESNIHAVFGSALHETIQYFLEMMYGESKKKALEIDTDAYLLDRMGYNFTKEYEKSGIHPATKQELMEFYQDGLEILKYFKSKLNKFYPKQGYKLVGIEYKLEEEVKPGVFFWGFIDVILEDVIAGKKIIIDIKTSTKGWSSYQKNDKVKTSQMLLYKKLYTEKEDVEINDVDVEYQIMKRKVFQDPTKPYHIPRISKFVPANGKPSVNKAWSEFMTFIDDVFEDGGEFKKDKTYFTKVSKLCDYCEFKDSGHCPAWQK